MDSGVAPRAGRDGRRNILERVLGLSGGGLSSEQREPAPEEGRRDGVRAWVSSLMIMPVVLVGEVACFSGVLLLLLLVLVLVLGVRRDEKGSENLAGRRCEGRGGERRPVLELGGPAAEDGRWNSASSALERTRRNGGRVEAG